AVAMSVSSEGLLIGVRDRGPGIAAADLPHLFDRFYRGREASRRVSGTGMGLSIARGLLAAEQGRIWPRTAPMEAPSSRSPCPLKSGRPRPPRIRCDGTRRQNSAGRRRGPDPARGRAAFALARL